MEEKKAMLSLLSAGLLIFVPLSAEAQHGFLDSYTDASTCLQCHAEAATEVMQSLHWTWELTDEITGQEVGKNRVINNYCVAVPSNEPRCTSCHVGVGWEDKSFDFSDSSQIDCLVCHDGTGTYSKVPTGAGAPDPSVDLLAVAQSVTLPDRNNCGSCHFYGGGGEGVKHGSMDSSLAEPSRELDVHMGGMDFQCTTCHVPDDNEPHHIVGTRYSQENPDHMMCQSCHTAEPHTSGMTNRHAERIACQTCHIPAYARGGKATKMTWDWSTAGQMNDEGKPYSVKDENGYEIYNTKKGSFTWEENVVPEYTWFNGTVTYTLLEDQLSPEEIVPINVLHGDIDDEKALIFPVKRFTGSQPYDAGAGTFAIPNLFPFPADDTDAYWKSFDWVRALSSGMEYVGKEFVGPVDYVDTEMLWIQNHMVAPKEQSLECADCHTYQSRMNFARLGYDREEAERLQLMMQSDFWADFPVTEDGWADTGDWMGWVNVQYDPWILVVDLDKYIYMPMDGLTEQGGWGYIPR